MPFKTYKEESKIDFGEELCSDQHPNLQQLQFGAIQRIANAAEVMAKNHQQLIDERDRYKQWYQEALQTTVRFSHQISGLRGYIIRIKNKKGAKK